MYFSFATDSKSDVNTFLYVLENCLRIKLRIVPIYLGLVAFKVGLFSLYVFSVSNPILKFILDSRP